MMDFYHLHKPIEYITARANPNVNIMGFGYYNVQWRFISCNKWNTLVAAIDNGGVYAAGSIWEIYIPFP